MDRDSGTRNGRVKAFKRSTPPAEMVRRRIAQPLVPGVLEVISRDGKTRYWVEIDEAGKAHCSCTAATYGLDCYHVTVAERRLRNLGAA